MGRRAQQRKAPINGNPEVGRPVSAAPATGSAQIHREAGTDQKPSTVGPQYIPIVWSHISTIAMVSYASNRPQNQKLLGVSKKLKRFSEPAEEA